MGSFQKIIFFDLEETLIDDWATMKLLSEENPHLKSWINSHGSFRAGLFSCAVWDERDLSIFKKELQERLEKEFGFVFDPSLFLTRDMMLEKIRVWSKKPFLNSDDFSDFFDKRSIMEMFWIHQFSEENTEIILLDDTVPNIKLISQDVKNNTCSFVNPKRWPKL